MGTTPTRGYPFPELDGDNNPPADIQALALAIENDQNSLHSSVANAAALPASGDFVGQRVLLLDTFQTVTWTGVVWRGLWQDYSPSWGGTIGNGTVVGRYLLSGGLVLFRAEVVGGTTTNWTSGSSLQLPVSRNGGRASFSGIARIGSSSYPIFGDCGALSSTVTLRTTPTTAGAALRTISATVPDAFGSTDALSVWGSYEPA